MQTTWGFLYKYIISTLDSLNFAYQCSVNIQWSACTSTANCIQKKGYWNGSLGAPFWKMAPFFTKGAVFSTILMFRKKFVPLEETELFFQKKRLETVPFWLPWGAIFQQKKVGKGSLRAPYNRDPFPTFCLITASFSLKGHYFSACVAIEDVWENSALLESGTNTGPLQDLFYGRSNGAPREPFWCHLFFECGWCQTFSSDWDLPILLDKHNKATCWAIERWTLVTFLLQHRRGHTQLLLAKVKNATRQNWYIYHGHGIGCLPLVIYICSMIIFIWESNFTNKP